jgi:hypothetical protein
MEEEIPQKSGEIYFIMKNDEFILKYQSEFGEG